MAYHGCIPLMKNFLIQVPQPSLLEIGIDKGLTMLPLMFFLSMHKQSYKFDAVDIRMDPNLQIILGNTTLKKTDNVMFHNVNSLEFLEKAAGQVKYDLALVDGDHNFYTVEKELQLLMPLMNPVSLIICDDYNGRWSERDLFYADRPEYKDNAIATKPVETEKHGVKAAVDDFVAAHPEWTLVPFPTGEPVILTRGVEIKIMNDIPGEVK